MKHIQLRVATLNICSLRYKINDLERLLDEEEIDIIGITETWLDSTFGDGELHIAGYTLHRLDRSGRRGGGVCVYCKDHIPVKQLHDLERDGLELTWLEIGSVQKYLFGCMYRPPQASLEF